LKRGRSNIGAFSPKIWYNIHHLHEKGVTL
jgi:hypothetical protein